jgi:hypothetical protein
MFVTSLRNLASRKTNPFRDEMDKKNRKAPKRCMFGGKKNFVPKLTMHKPAHRPRAVLTASQVVAIFQSRAVMRSSSKVSRMYGVSEKTIRDIWVGRTWKAETRHLDPLRPLEVQHGQGPTQGKARDRHSTRVRDRLLVSAEEAGWHLTESLNAGSHKNSLDFREHAALVIESAWPSASQSIDGLTLALEQAGNHALLLINPDLPSPSQSIDDLLFDWEQAASRDRSSDRDVPALEKVYLDI